MSKNRPQKSKPAARQPVARSIPAPGPPHISANFAVVAIGASAGGLDACQKFLDALPADTGMAFVLVQHLDPAHESMMVDLLVRHTSMTVLEATDGMRFEREHFYIIPPGTYLSIGGDVLHVSRPQTRQGARLPFDFLLHSLAEEYGPRAIGIILSGTGADGSLGLKTLKEKGGLVIAQDPDEAGFDGMPRSAIATGAVDLVLPVAKIPAALGTYDPRTVCANPIGLRPQEGAPNRLSEVIDLLRTRTAHDFTHYKPGTLQRRIERRMALAAIKPDDMDRYLKILRADADELVLLAKDLLINVTSFFRDPKIFEFLRKTILPTMVRGHTADRPLRIWIAGCSTGEEAYSIAMLLREEIATAKSNVKLQVFASDVDPDAVATAREGLYPETIEADVSPARLARFFSKEDQGYRVSPELRATVVFTVQDVLADPPFSRLDLVSCRNLLIYLRSEAQEKLISVFHFALREGGTLLLGSAEILGNPDGRFEVISKPERCYRNIGRSLPGEFGISISPADAVRGPVHQGQRPAPLRPTALAELCRRLVMETYAPAAVLINSKHECLYTLGPTDRYLRVVPGHPTQDLLAMAREGIRVKLRTAVQRAAEERVRVIIAGGEVSRDGSTCSFNIAVEPVPSEGEDLLLVCFLDDLKPKLGRSLPAAPEEVSQVAELEHELEATKAELHVAIRNLGISSEEQRAINEEALSVNEEYQSTNEELLTSKEELQSLNEELSALNSQLQETLERQRMTSNDLQNVLYSTDVATLFLDTKLHIRFFTPATKLLFNIIPSDLGRPLADLTSLAADSMLSVDARIVLTNLMPVEREIEAKSDLWFVRRILPYRTDDDKVEGVVITFTDVTERRNIAKVLEATEQQAQLATIAKSRFLAAASHDLRQPLQTVALLQGLLAKAVEGEKAQKLVARLGDTLGAMSGMLNTLLDINQIEAGTVRAALVNFPINELLDRLRDEFTYHAQAQRLTLRVVRCGLFIRSDPRLLEQMIRNLLSNALKYTKHGKVLLGCRRRSGKLNIEIWDTGIGIPDEEQQAIFEEYHQLDNAARERSRGLGLGLSIVKRLGGLLGYAVRVRSQPGKGSVFIVETGLALCAKTPEHQPHRTDSRNAGAAAPVNAILVVEDDPDVRELLELFLTGEGYHTLTAPDGLAALDLAARGTPCPDLILADYNLPNGMTGLAMAAKLRERFQRQIPVVIVTGDISTATLGEISRQDCVQINKPVKLKDLMQVIQRLLPVTQPPALARPSLTIGTGDRSAVPVVFVVDDDSGIRDGIRSLLEDAGRTVEAYASCEEFLEAYRPGREACLLVDAYLPGMKGLELLQRLDKAGDGLPAIMITGISDVPMAVQAMKAGASDFIEKPISAGELLAGVERALEQSRDSNKLFAWREDSAQRLAGLTLRQRQIMELILAGHPNKNIAADLGISQRTVENHRASIMEKTGAKSLPALARLALTAAWNSASEQSGKASLSLAGMPDKGK